VPIRKRFCVFPPRLGWLQKRIYWALWDARNDHIMSRCPFVLAKLSDSDYPLKEGIGGLLFGGVDLEDYEAAAKRMEERGIAYSTQYKGQIIYSLVGF